MTPVMGRSLQKEEAETQGVRVLGVQRAWQVNFVEKDDPMAVMAIESEELSAT